MLLKTRFKFFGPRFNTLADEIFADAVDAAANLNSGGGAETIPPAAAATETDETQDVDPNKEGQGKENEQPPETPGESADDKSGEKADEADKKQKKDGAAEARKWGEGWKKTADEHAAKLKEAEPLLKLVEEQFGGEANLSLAAEVYRVIANEDEFNPEQAVEFLSEAFPGVAEKLVTHITKNVIDRATSTAIARKFGRELSDDDIKAVGKFLAAGKPSDLSKFDAFFDGEDIPEHLKFDAEGDERDPAVLDYIRNQQRALRETQAQIKSLEGRVTGADTQRHEKLASEAIESYVDDNFIGISEKVAELNLDKPIEGETPDITELRTKYSNAIEGIALHLASQDSVFQGMYEKALKAVAKNSLNNGHKVSKAEAQDLSRRIRAKVNSFAAEAAELISPLIDALAAKRGEQVEKVKQARVEPDAPGSSGKPAARETDPDRDPFDDDDIQAEVSDLMRARRGGR